MIESIAQTICTEAAKSGVSFLSAATKRANDNLVKESNKKKSRSQARIHSEFDTPRPLLADSLVRHVGHIRQWSGFIRFEDLQADKVTAKVHVPLDVYLIQRSRHETENEEKDKVSLVSALTSTPGHCVILGNTGAGKTTSIKSICLDYFKTGRALLNYSFPILIQLHELEDEEVDRPLLSKLKSILSLHVSFRIEGGGASPLKAEVEAIEQDLLLAYLDGLKCLILLDGFDEITTEKTKQKVARDFEKLTKSLSQTRLILTSRNHEFTGAREWTKRFELASLDENQIELFANQWLGSKETATQFLFDLRASPFYDVSIRPLTIAHLCAIYERTGAIPEKPKSAYERIVNLLLRNWDNERGIKRSSIYAKFDTDRKRTYLAQLAYELTVGRQRVRFDSRVLREIYQEICEQHGLPKDQATQVSNEIESHTGLLIQSGHDHFEFAHKSIREYLAADYIIRLPSISYLGTNFGILPNELAIATSLSSRPGDYLVEILRAVLTRETIDQTWYSIFAERLFLEKPDLATGRVADTTAYVLNMIGRTGFQERFISLFSRMLPSNVEDALSHDYVQFKKTFDGIEYMRTRNNHLIPQSVFVPFRLTALQSKLVRG